MPPFTIDAQMLLRAQRITNRMLDRSHTLVTAESCTAGLIATLMAQAERATDVLHGGFVTYTKPQKEKSLGVLPQLFEKHGAVNGEVAIAMADGALARSVADMAVAITGVLGPMPDEDGNPVGLIYVAIKNRRGHTKLVSKRLGKKDHVLLLRKTALVVFDVLDEFLHDTAGDLQLHGQAASLFA